jgi:hypothetical protein
VNAREGGFEAGELKGTSSERVANGVCPVGVSGVLGPEPGLVREEEALEAGLLSEGGSSGSCGKAVVEVEGGIG